MLLCSLCNKLCRRLYGSVGKTGRGEKGKFIKRLNSENKQLFGDLLETLPERRLRRQTNEPIDNKNDCINNIVNVSKNKEMSSEIWWWEKSSKKIPIRFKNHQQALTAKQAEATKITLEDTPQPILKPEPNATLNIHVGQKSESANKPQNDPHKCTEVHGNSIIPPAFIIKHSPSFPLENINRSVVGWTLPVEEILRISMGSSSGQEKVYSGYPSVSKILNATMSDSARLALQKWEERMMEKLGLEGFRIYKQGLLDQGKLFHTSIQRILSGESPSEFPVEAPVKGCLNSLQGILSDFTGVKALESHVVHSQLMYHGIIDCVAMYRGKPFLIEWKKSDSQKSSVYSTFDAPLQVAAYMGAMNYDDNYNFKVQGGLVVVAYTDGSPAHSHLLTAADCSHYWHSWLKRLQLYWARNSLSAPSDPERLPLRTLQP